MNLELKVKEKVNEKGIEDLVNEKEVTEEKIEESLNYDLLTKEEKAAIDEFNEKIDINDSAQVLQFGAAAQNNLSEFSDSAYFVLSDCALLSDDA